MGKKKENVKQARRPVALRRELQFSYLRPPEFHSTYQVGDVVEVYCDHERNKTRVRGWVKGIVVQVDNKMVAVQFRQNVFLTDGWMVPDRILWYPLDSDAIRPAQQKQRRKKKAEDEIPEY